MVQCIFVKNRVVKNENTFNLNARLLHHKCFISPQTVEKNSPNTVFRIKIQKHGRTKKQQFVSCQANTSNIVLLALAIFITTCCYKQHASRTSRGYVTNDQKHTKKLQVKVQIKALKEWQPIEKTLEQLPTFSKNSNEAMCFCVYSQCLVFKIGFKYMCVCVYNCKRVLQR